MEKDLAKRAKEQIHKYDGGDVIYYNEISYDTDEEGNEVSSSDRKIFKVLAKYPTKSDAAKIFPRRLLNGVEKTDQIVVAKDKVGQPYMFTFSKNGIATAFPVWIEKSRWNKIARVGDIEPVEFSESFILKTLGFDLTEAEDQEPVKKDKFDIAPEYPSNVSKEQILLDAANSIKRYDGGDSIIYNKKDSNDDSKTKRMIFSVQKKYESRDAAIEEIPRKILMEYDRKNQFVIANDKMGRPYLFSFSKQGYATSFPRWIKPSLMKNVQGESACTGSLNMFLLNG